MSDLSDAEKLEIIERLAKWAGWTHQVVRPCWGLPCYRSGPHPDWNPFVSLGDARMLLNECDRRGLIDNVISELVRDCKWDQLHLGLPFQIMRPVLLATPEQITRAVWEVVRGLEQGKDGD